MVTGQKIQSDRGPSKTVASSDAAKVSRKRTKAEKGRKKENERKGQARQAMGAVGDFAASIAAGLLAEAEQKGSGAGFAAAFAQGVSPIVDYGKIMRGKADPGTVLGRVGQRVMEENQRFSVADTAKAAAKAAQDVLDDEPVDPLLIEPDELTDEKIEMNDEGIAEAAKAAVDAAVGPTDPFEVLRLPTVKFSPTRVGQFRHVGRGTDCSIKLFDKQVRCKK